MKSAFLVLSITGLIGLQSAYALSSEIPLNGVVIGPGQTQYLSFSNLYGNVNYKLTCSMKNQIITNSDTKNDIQLYINSSSVSVWIDSSHISHKLDGTIVDQFLSSGSILEIFYIDKQSVFSIKNIDFTDSIELFNCKATPRIG